MNKKIIIIGHVGHGMSAVHESIARRLVEASIDHQLVVAKPEDMIPETDPAVVIHTSRKPILYEAPQVLSPLPYNLPGTRRERRQQERQRRKQNGG